LPSVAVTGISVNGVAVAPGANVTGGAVNTCAQIGGAVLEPLSLTAAGVVHAVGVPRDSRTTITFTTPWAAIGGGTVRQTGPLATVLLSAIARGTTTMLGGRLRPGDYFRALTLPDGEPTTNYIDGRYALTVSVRIPHRTLRSSGAVVLAC
jgi:hypothetical protein